MKRNDASRSSKVAAAGQSWIRRWICAIFLAACAAAPCAAQAPTPEGALTGTLQKARSSGAVTIGYRESSIPLSYLSPRKEPIGYSIDICRAIVDAMSLEVGHDLEIQWVPVTSENRIDAVVSGKVDLECGSTTANQERKKVVDFSPVIFVAGTKLMVRKGSPIRSFRDLGGKTVIVTVGTTNEKAIRDLVAKLKIPATIVTGSDHADSYAQLVGGKVDAFATDDVLLYGFITLNGAQDQLAVVGEFLSYDPYGIMFRKNDPQLAALVIQTMHDLAASRELEQTYNKWFLRQLPSGQRLNLPMSAQLTEMIRIMGDDATTQ
ncbi:MAG TPA: amino acid ABC transporter substrate-binding protein [Casimicrobiaceae bacterium]